MTQRERGPNREVKGGGATGVVINKLLVRVLVRVTGGLLNR
jgi:hypothetical protein